MTVDTKTVAGRRKLRFNSVDEILADAEAMAAQPVKPLGNWTPGQNFKHLAMTLDAAVDGVDFKAPLLFRILGRLFKKKFLTQPLKAGFQMPDEMKDSFMPPDGVTIEEGLADLRAAMERYKATTTFAPHPVFGNISREEHDLMHMRHAEMHLSFIVPDDESADAAAE